MVDSIPMHGQLTAGKVRAALKNLPDNAIVAVVTVIGPSDGPTATFQLPVDVINVEENRAEIFTVFDRIYAIHADLDGVEGSKAE